MRILSFRCEAYILKRLGNFVIRKQIVNITIELLFHIELTGLNNTCSYTY